MSGNVLSLQARRTQNGALGGYGHDGWHVDLRLQSHNNSQMQNALLRLRVRNFRGITVLEVLNVWRVQFVPTTNQDNKFHLRLFQNYENWERESIVSDDANFFLHIFLACYIFDVLLSTVAVDGTFHPVICKFYPNTSHIPVEN